MSTITNLKPSISYPWITAEIVWDGEHIFEPNFNCGILSVALYAIDKVKESQKQNILNMIINIFEEVRLNNDKIIFITDENVWNLDILKSILREIFWEWNYSIVWTKMLNWNKNPLTWDAIRASEFVSKSDLVNSVRENPDAVVLSSIAYSDPRVREVLGQLSWYENTKAYQTLRLLDLNADRKNHIEVAWNEIWNLWVIEEPWRVFDFLTNWISQIVVKTVDGSAWWNAVNILLNESQVQVFVEKANWPHIVNRFIRPQLLVSQEWSFPFHIRPFFSSEWKYLWSALKISGKPADFWIVWAWRNAIQRLSEWTNTSSWLSKTFIFDKNWNVIIWFISKNSWALWQKESEEYLSWFELKWERVTSEIINNLALQSEYIIRSIQGKTNLLLWL